MVPEQSPTPDDESTDDEHATSPQDVLRELSEGDRIKMMLDESVRIIATVDEMHDNPGNPDGVLMDWDRQISANVSDDAFEEEGDIHSWHISTRRREGEWDAPRATAWFLESDGMIEGSTQSVTSLTILEQHTDT